MAALHVIKQRAHEAEAAMDPARLHRWLVEDVLGGLDVNRTAIQLAACNLTLGAPTVDYKRMNLLTLKHGPQPDGSVRTGSLEILGAAERAGSLHTLIRPLRSMEGLAAEQVDSAEAEFPLKGLDLVLKQASRARVASFGCASWHKANLGAAQRTMSQVARDEMACAKRTFGTFPHRFRL